MGSTFTKDYHQRQKPNGLQLNMEFTENSSLLHQRGLRANSVLSLSSDVQKPGATRSPRSGRLIYVLADLHALPKRFRGDSPSAVVNRCVIIRSEPFLLNYVSKIPRF